MSLPLLYLDIRGVERDDGTRVQAVRIACDSEVYELDKPRHERLTISAFDDVFNDSLGSTSAKSDLSRFLGIPLSARRIPLENFARLNWRNAGAVVLFRNCDIGSTLDPAQGPFGSIPDYWSPNTGPIVAARLDKKPLHPLHMAAISAFITKELGRLFLECKEAEQAWRDQYHYDTEATYDQHQDTSNNMLADGAAGNELHSSLWHIFEHRRQVLAAATPERFEQFFWRYKAQRVRGRPELMAPWHELTSRQRRESQIIELEEIEPRPEWSDVMSPLQV